MKETQYEKLNDVNIKDVWNHFLYFKRKYFICAVVVAVVLLIGDFLYEYNLYQNRNDEELVNNYTIAKEEYEIAKSKYEDIENDYNKSTFMKLNPDSFYMAELIYGVSLDTHTEGQEAIFLKKYAVLIFNPTLLQDIVDITEFDGNYKHLKELINADVLPDGTGVKITVKHTDAEILKKITDAIIKCYEEEEKKCNEEIGPHKCILLHSAIERTSDTTLSELQANYIENKGAQESYYVQKESEYLELSEKTNMTLKSVVTTVGLVAICGFVGTFVAGFLYSAVFVLTTDKLRNATQLKKGFKLNVFLFGFNTTKSEYLNQKICMVQGIPCSNILIVTSNKKINLKSYFDEIVKISSLKEKEVTMTEECFNSVEDLQKLDESDAVVLLEKQYSSDLKEIEEILETVKIYNKNILGVIVV